MDPTRFIYDPASSNSDRGLTHSHQDRAKDLKQYIDDGGDLNVRVTFLFLMFFFCFSFWCIFFVYNSLIFTAIKLRNLNAINLLMSCEIDLTGRDMHGVFFGFLVHSFILLLNMDFLH